jgi:hypothetical protein
MVLILGQLVALVAQDLTGNHSELRTQVAAAAVHLVVLLLLAAQAVAVMVGQRQLAVMLAEMVLRTQAVAVAVVQVVQVHQAQVPQVGQVVQVS